MSPRLSTTTNVSPYLRTLVGRVAGCSVPPMYKGASEGDSTTCSWVTVSGDIAFHFAVQNHESGCVRNDYALNGPEAGKDLWLRVIVNDVDNAHRHRVDHNDHIVSRHGIFKV